MPSFPCRGGKRTWAAYGSSWCLRWVDTEVTILLHSSCCGLPGLVWYPDRVCPRVLGVIWRGCAVWSRITEIHSSQSTLTSLSQALVPHAGARGTAGASQAVHHYPRCLLPPTNTVLQPLHRGRGQLAPLPFPPCQGHILSPSLMFLPCPLPESPPLELEKPDPVWLVSLVILPPSSLNNGHDVEGWGTQEEWSLPPTSPSSGRPPS